MKFYQNLDLTDYNSYKIKSIAKNAFFPESVEDIKWLMGNISNPIFIGGGNNIILSKNYYEEENFIIFRENFSDITIENETVTCLSGVDLKELSLIALENNLSGLEIYFDIPGTVGGAVVMNAGAQGEDFSQLLQEVTILDNKTGELKIIKGEEIGYSYRNSLFQNQSNIIVIEAKLKLKKSTRDIILEKMETTEANRHKKQPREYPNAGSVFKRPKGFYVGPLIESLGLKGYTIGGAMISTKHAGFIVNKGNATGEDIIELINYIKSAVWSNCKVNLEVEQKII